MYLQLLLLATTATVATAKTFSGLGQIRTIYIGRGHDDLGCLTRSGQWTTNEAQCGTFTAEPISENTFSLFAPSHGGMAGGVEVCGVDVATLKCGGGVKGAIFGTFGEDGPIPGREVLRYGEYGVVATNAEDSPPSLKDEALDVHFYSGSEKGKWVWLAWKSLEGDANVDGIQGTGKTADYDPK